jgi:cytochrome bd-type quinol oxidase subunit 2
MSMAAQSQSFPSKFIARLVGPVMIVAGATFVFNDEASRAIVEDFIKGPAALYLAGVLTLLTGLAIVNVHNSWVGGWPLIITIFGWLAIIGGTLRVAFPQLVAAIGADLYAQPAVIIAVGAIILVVGTFLSFKGYSV